MQVKADNSRVLMSEALRGQLPDLDDAGPAALEGSYVHAVVDATIGDKQTAFVGILRSVLFGDRPEIELRLQLEEAIAFAKASSPVVTAVHLLHGDEEVELAGPFTVVGLRLDDINAVEQLCVMSLGLQRAA
jgi:hypothetical protein